MNTRDHADVVVIGAGIAGASAAWALAADLDVVLVELEAQAGLHATGRSAAIISETYGPRTVCALASASRSFLTEPPADISGSSLVAPRGLLWVATADAVPILDDVATGALSAGVTVEALTTDEALAMVPVLRESWISGALLEPDALSIDVAGLLAGYLTAFRRRDGAVRLASPALRLEPGSSGWTVTTAEGTIECSTVINAAGAWADDVAVRAGLRPIGLQPLLRTAFTFPVDEASGWPLVMDAGGEFYFEPEGPGILVSPADETPSEPCDARPEELAIALATDALIEATTLRVRGVRNSWAGLRTFAPDRLPVVGEDPEATGFYWLAGQGGAGIKTSPAMARAIAALVLDGSLPADLTRFGVDADELSPARLR